MASATAPAFTPAISPPAGVIPNPNPHDGLRTTVIISLTICLAAPTILVPLRMWIRGYIMKELHIVDVICAMAYCFFAALATMSLSEVSNGVGNHAWNLSVERFSRYLERENFTQIVYMPSICLTKITIILQFIHLFVVGGRNGRWYFLQALLWLNLTFYLILMFLEIFQCLPRVKIWKADHPGKCINITQTFVATAAINVVSDLSILIAPVFWILKLQLQTRRKLGILVVFGTGVFACICSILRVVVSVRNVDSLDTTYTLAPVNLWAVAEVSSGLIIACLPFLPRLLMTRSKASNYSFYGTANSDQPTVNSHSRKAYLELDQFGQIRPAQGGADDVESQSSISQLKTEPNGSRFSREEGGVFGSGGKDKEKKVVPKITKTVSISQSTGRADQDGKGAFVFSDGR